METCAAGVVSSGGEFDVVATLTAAAEVGAAAAIDTADDAETGAALAATRRPKTIHT